MNLCLNAFVIQFPNGLLDICSVTAPRALLLRYAHRGHCKDEDSYKERWSHVEFSISLTSNWTASCNPFLSLIEAVCRKTLQNVNRDSGQNPRRKISVKNHISAKIRAVV